MKTLAPRVRTLQAGKVSTLTVRHVARPSGGKWAGVRAKALARDGGLCQACKARGLVTIAAEVDHVVALDRGGDPLDLGNLQSLCIPCHEAKSKGERRPDAHGVGA